MSFYHGLKQGERVYIEFLPKEQCPQNEHYVFRVMTKAEVRDEEGRLVRDLLTSKKG